MPVCITGMHWSGTSLVARVLNDCGLYLGPEQELAKPNRKNREGFWENFRFVDLNDALLAAVGGAWDRPPVVESGWEEVPEVEPLREQALELIAQFRPHEPWGWTDPPNSLTLRFWRRLLPDLTIVACVWDPIEVADSLAARGLPPQHKALELWLMYNRRLVETVPLDELTVVHYGAFFRALDEEVQRLAQALPLRPSDVQTARAALRKRARPASGGHRSSERERSASGERRGVLRRDARRPRERLRLRESSKPDV